MTIDTASRPCIDNDLQHLRADLALHWEDSDTVAKEMFSNVCCCLTIMRTMLSLIFSPLGLSDMYMYRICSADVLIIPIANLRTPSRVPRKIPNRSHHCIPEIPHLITIENFQPLYISGPALCVLLLPTLLRPCCLGHASNTWLTKGRQSEIPCQ
jgi:hypothetical protein